jgi:hypothetical protein|tara:strand:+ start:567 stop:1166 length:600 start_codon:yes stop_codon:yes gene_type:complete
MTAEEFIKQAHDQSKGKVCSKCKEHKLLSEFDKGIRHKDGLQYQCKSCIKEYKDNVCRFKKWFQNKKGRVKQKGNVEFTILPTDIPGVKIREVITKGIGENKYGSFNRKYKSWEATEYPKVCTVLGIKLDWDMNGCNNNSPSLDRVNPKLGYIKGNVIMMSNLANKMKNNATPEELKQFSEYHLSHQQLDTNPNQIGLF